MLKDYFKHVLKEVSLDCVIFGFSENKLKILLLKWKNINNWSLPGGRIKREEDVDDAVNRILYERTGLKEVFLQQFNTFGRADRYDYISEKETIRLVEKTVGESVENLGLSRRTISIGYYALVNIDRVVARPDIFTDECKWWDIEDVPNLLFDHNAMIITAMKTLRKEVRYQPVGDLLPDKFTLNEIHKLFESIMDAELDRRNFHKLITSYDFLIRLNEKRTGVANKAPYLYKFDYRKYYKALKEGVGV